MVSTRKDASKKREAIFDASSIDYNSTCVSIHLPHSLTPNMCAKKTGVAVKLIRDAHS